MSINSVTISGNLTRDAENRVTQGGMTIVSFGVAVNDRRKNNQTGEWEDHANFVDCVMFGRRAESLAPYLVKGCKVFVQGKLNYSSWEDRNGGGKRSKLEVVVSDIDLGGTRAQGASNGQQRQSGSAAPQQRQAQPVPAYSDEDIPF